MQLHHINIQASEDLLEQEKAFFCSILGLEVGFRPKISSQGYWLYADNKPIVHLSISDNHVKNEKQGVFDHVAFLSTGLQSFIALLQENNIAYTVMYNSETHTSQVFFKSPLGVGIEIAFCDEQL